MYLNDKTRQRRGSEIAHLLGKHPPGEPQAFRSRVSSGGRGVPWRFARNFFRGCDSICLYVRMGHCGHPVRSKWVASGAAQRFDSAPPELAFEEVEKDRIYCLFITFKDQKTENSSRPSVEMRPKMTGLFPLHSERLVIVGCRIVLQQKFRQIRDEINKQEAHGSPLKNWALPNDPQRDANRRSK